MNDDKLIKLIKQKPSKGLAAAIDIYGSLVKTIVIRIIGYENQQDVEEAVSDVFAQLWKSIYNFNPEKGNLKNYLTSISRHVGINTFQRKLIKHEIIPIEENDLEVEIDLENEVSETINKKIIKETIDGLPHPDREIFVRRYYLFESVKEIATSLNLNTKTVENKLYRGRLKLKSQLINNGIIL